MPAQHTLIDAATALRPLLRKHAATIERERRLDAPVLAALHAMDAFHLQLGADHGGAAADPITHLRVIEELSRGDASSGWCAMVGSESSAVVNACLPSASIQRMSQGSPRPTLSFSAVGTGRAEIRGEGYVVSGRWRFTSGCRHASWLGGLCALHDDQGPRLRPNGAPELRVMFVPASSAVLHDTWQTSGLKGTASDDFSLTAVFVPGEFAANLFAPANDPSPVWRLPASLRLALSKAAAVCGMARAALDAVLPLLERTPFVGGRPAREEARVHVALAEAEGTLESGRAHLYQQSAAAWEVVLAGGSLDQAAVARVRLAVVSAARQAVATVHLAQQLAGSASIFDATLDRAARDIEVARHHFQLQPHVMEDVGRTLLGMAPRNPMF